MTPLQRIGMYLVMIYGPYYVRMVVRELPRWIRLRRMRRACRDAPADLRAWAAARGLTVGTGEDPVLAEDAARAVALAGESGPRGLGQILAGTLDGRRVVLVESWPEHDDLSPIATALLVETPVARAPEVWPDPDYRAGVAREVVMDGAIVLSRPVRLDEASATALLERAAALEAGLRGGSGTTQRVVASDVQIASPDTPCIQF